MFSSTPNFSDVPQPSSSGSTLSRRWDGRAFEILCQISDAHRRASDGFVPKLGRMPTMPESAKRERGRPSTGNTEQVWGRVSVDLNKWVEARAAELGLSKARVVGALLEFAHAHEAEVTYPLSTARREAQQELPLEQAS
jgi:hypothetical protein